MEMNALLMIWHRNVWERLILGR